MANEENLIPLNKRPKSEQRKIAAKGGQASGESRRKRRAMRESMEWLLNLPPSTIKDFNKLTKAGFPIEEIDNSQLIILALFERAKSGDVAAIKELRNLIGEDISNTDANTPIVISGENELEK